MRILNRPEVSGVTAFAYGILLTFLGAVTVFFLFAGFYTSMGMFVGITIASVSAFVAIIMLLLMLSLYQTRYILTDEELIIKTSVLIGGSKNVPLRTVQSVEETLIPFGIRLFGASFHGGYYYVPGLGKAFLTITNFRDGLLIKTDSRNFVITPSKPLDFKEAIQSRMKNL